MERPSILCFLITILAGLSAFGQAISSFDPGLGSTGDTVFISGSGFFPGTLVVRFNGTYDSSALANAGGTLITAHVPSGATTGPISVQINTGTPVSSSQDFTVFTGPYATNFTPAVGGNRASITIGGLHLLSTSGVLFNGKPAFSFFASSDFTMNAQAPDGVNTGPITVYGGGGTNTTSSNFFVPPVLTGFAPSNGRTGTNVLVTGSNFLGATAVHFGSITVTTLNVLSNGALVVSAPTNVATGTIRVDTPGGSITSSSNFVVQPVIYGFSPNFGPPTTSVTVTGANFNVGTPTIRFAGVSAAVSGITFGQLTAQAPSSSSNGPISITTTDGSYTTTNNYFYPASITNFSPTNSPTNTTVTITGQNLLGTSAVAFNGAPANFTFPSNNTTLLAVVPYGVTTGPITVTTPAGSTNSQRLFYAAPAIYGFSPTSGLPGTNVVITGTNLLGATAVTFNGTNAAFTNLDNGHIRATVPNGAQTGPITVIAPAGSATSSTSFVLNYTSDLSVNLADAPDPVFIGSNLVYTITIANGGPFDSPGAFLTNTLPGSVALKAATTSQGTLATNGNPITANLGPIANGHQAVVTLTVAPQATGPITNMAAVAGITPDSSLGNNTALTSTTVLPLALLSIQFVPPNRVRLAWPVALSNFNLEYKPLLANTNYWSNVPTPPVVSGSENVVNETNTNPKRFYRLRK
jgi:hypothetical protein